jgi:cellulose synthase/poly-beta-1,6-N-acetylglucosamine synthase-like glycosyltransferase
VDRISRIPDEECLLRKVPEADTYCFSDHLSPVIGGLLASAAFGSLACINGVFWTSSVVGAVFMLLKTLFETMACCYAMFYLFVSWFYRPFTRRSADATTASAPAGSVAVGYLCCNDLDEAALESIIAHLPSKTWNLWIHDDSSRQEDRLAVKRAAKRLAKAYDRSVHIVRRRSRSGGKPGAVNNLVSTLPWDVEFLLLCDSDSYFYDDVNLERALGYFLSPDVALVQFRNTGHVTPTDSRGYRILSRAVTFYDIFVYFMDRYGWSPFLGHNAVIRVSTFREVGGLTPGELADDIDFSVKLYLNGYRIRYAREIICGERHPMSYDALRLRTRKWTHGCTQILLNWSWAVLTSQRLHWGAKATFFLTVSFYHLQVAFLIYIFLFYLVWPLWRGCPATDWRLLVAAGLLLLFTFFPSIVYYARQGQLGKWPGSALCWGVVYGSQDFVMFSAVMGCLFTHRAPAWVPTNVHGNSAGRGIGGLMFEVVFGVAIVLVVAWRCPILLTFPTTWLFAGKFFFTPWFEKLVFKYF